MKVFTFYGCAGLWHQHLAGGRLHRLRTGHQAAAGAGTGGKLPVATSRSWLPQIDSVNRRTRISHNARLDSPTVTFPLLYAT